MFLARIFDELLSRDLGQGPATEKPQGVEPSMVRRKVRHPRKPGFRLVEPAARNEGRPYPRLQSRPIREISKLGRGEKKESQKKWEKWESCSLILCRWFNLHSYSMLVEAAAGHIGIVNLSPHAE